MNKLSGYDIADDDLYDYEIDEPQAVFTNERRLHVRAYNHWASLLGDRALPSIEDLNPAQLEDFSPNSVLLDFSLGVENPAVLFLGSALREECGITGPVERISDVPPRSLLTRLTDHYMQIIANCAPVGFEAEFTNQRGVEIMYRGILMPFSSDGDSIDFIYGVISWKEAASEAFAAALNAEIENALKIPSPPVADAPVWADAPLSQIDNFGFDEFPVEGASAETGMTETAIPGLEDEAEEDSTLDLDAFFELPADIGTMESANALAALGDLEEIDEPEAAELDELDLSAFALEAEEAAQAPAEALPDLEALDVLDDQDLAATPIPAEAGLSDLSELMAELEPRETGHDLGEVLEAARQSASEVQECDARSRAALYRAVGHAYDFALSAREHPADYDAMLAQSGIAMQERSPMTAVIKLVFGADYDKTRIAEYATALEYAFANDLPHGSLARQLAFYQGGLKGLVRDMRNSRRDGAAARPGQRVERARTRLKKAKSIPVADLPVDAEGLTVAVVRREADGTLSVLAALDTEQKAAQLVMVEATRRRKTKADASEG